MNFNELIENKKIIKALEEMNIFEATPIQTESIPLLLDHNDVIGQAQTGTGKTFAYAIPLIENINDESKNIEALVLTPTRELSIQVAKEIEKLSKDIKKLKISTIYGGESYDKQFDSLKRNPQIVIGTPGRIIDMMERGKLKFDNVKYLVLDEADEMLKMGFEDDLETILKETPKNRQTALFSATLPPFIKNVSKKYMIDPKFVKIDAKSLTVENINQMVYYVKRESKKDLLLRLLDLYEFNSVMIFTNTKSMVDELVLYLQSLNFKADGLHGDLKQKSRERVMDAYRTGAINILIATDVAARGIDVSGIEAVINYDIPNEDELYVHRIGRTARAGTYGVAITFATSHSRRQIEELEKYIHHKITVLDIPTIDDIKAKRQKNLYLKINEKMESLEDMHKYDSLILKLSKQNKDPMPLINALLEMINTNDRTYNDIQSVTFKSKNSKSKGKKDNKKEKAKGFSDVKEKSIISVNVGKKDNVRPNQLVVYFHDELKIHREHFGKIVIKDNESFIEINSDALRFLRDLNKHRFNGRRIDYKKVDKMPK